MADRCGARLERDVTLERRRESFSNRLPIRKILPENNALAGRSICLFGASRRHSALAGIEAEGRAQPGMGRKSPGRGASNPLKTGSGGARGTKFSEKLDESLQLD
jgi:hypothetical protein